AYSRHALQGGGRLNEGGADSSSIVEDLQSPLLEPPGDIAHLAVDEEPFSGEDVASDESTRAGGQEPCGTGASRMGRAVSQWMIPEDVAPAALPAAVVSVSPGKAEDVDEGAVACSSTAANVKVMASSDVGGVPYPGAHHGSGPAPSTGDGGTPFRSSSGGDDRGADGGFGGFGGGGVGGSGGTPAAGAASSSADEEEGGNAREEAEGVNISHSAPATGADAAPFHAPDELQGGRVAGGNADVAGRRDWGPGVGAIHYWLKDLAMERRTELAIIQQQQPVLFDRRHQQQQNQQQEQQQQQQGTDYDGRTQTQAQSRPESLPPLDGSVGNGGGMLLVADPGLISGISVCRAAADVQRDLPSSGDGGAGGDASIGTLGPVDDGSGGDAAAPAGPGVGGSIREECSGRPAETNREGFQAAVYATNMVGAEAAVGLVRSRPDVAEESRERATREGATENEGIGQAARWTQSYGGSVEAEVSEGLLAAAAVQRHGGDMASGGTDSELQLGGDASSDEAERAATEKVVELLTHPEEFIQELQEEEGPGWVSPDYVMGVVAAAKDPGVGIPQRHQQRRQEHLQPPPEQDVLVPELEEGIGRGSGPQGGEQLRPQSPSDGEGAPRDDLQEFLQTGPLYGAPGASHHHPAGPMESWAQPAGPAGSISGGGGGGAANGAP
ncbi:hypothetical protein Vretimale_5029, partial [Volvox reticuliferus]